MNVLIVGGGIAGLLAAHVILDEAPAAAVTIVEAGPEAGGLLAGYAYADEGMWFDCGTHIFRETGNARIDDIIRSGLPDDQWIRFPRGRGDIVGSIYGGHLQLNTHFPDLRQSGLVQRILSEMKQCAASGVGPIGVTESAEDVFVRRFGRTAWPAVASPILESVYKRKADELAAFSLLALGLTRLLVTDLDQWGELSGTPGLGHLIAHPEQRLLPVELSSPLISFYPRSGGTRSLISGLTQRLEGRGVRFLYSSRVDASEWVSSSGVSAVSVAIGGSHLQVDAEFVIWTAGLFPLARSMRIDFSKFGFDAPMPHSVLNLKYDRTNLEDAFYILGLDPNCTFFRATNYGAFAGAENDGKLSVEVLGGGSRDTSTVAAAVTENLKAAGGLPQDARMEFARMHTLEQGFPSPTMRNFLAIATMREDVRRRLPRGVVLTGLHADAGLFFQKDVMAHAYNAASTIAGQMR